MNLLSLKRWARLSSSVLLTGRLIAATTTTLYVATAPDGNDAWTGTKSSANGAKTDGPVATLQKAIDLARANTQKPVRIELRGGFHFLQKPIILTEQDSGLTLTSRGKEKPVLSGGRLIEGWKQESLNGRTVWTTDLTKFDPNWTFHELWINGQRATRARYPNQGYLKVAEVPEKTTNWFQGNLNFKFTGGDLPAWENPKDGEAMVMNRWVESRLPITAIDQKQRLISFGKRSVFELASNDLYFIENVREALDEPGEWYLDYGAKKLFYIPRPGEQLSQIQAIAPVLSQLIKFEGKDKLVENIHISNLTFSHTEWCFPTGFDSGNGAPEIEPKPAADVGGFGQAAIGVPGAVWAHGARNCTFENCLFTNLGTYGLELRRGCVSNKVVHCEFFDLGGGGIKIGDTRIPGSTAEFTEANEVTDCTIRDGGKMFPSAIGVWIGQSPNNSLVHNEIADLYYTGISIGWTWGYGPALATNNYVAWNHVHHIGKKSNGDGPILSDMGGIYTLGMQPGTRIFNNLWHDIAGVQYGGWGIYFDEGSCSIIARSNIVYNTTHGGFHQHYGATNQVENNIFAFARDQQIQRSRQESHISFLFTTNIVYFEQGVLLGSSWADDKFVTDWNLYWDARPDQSPDSMKFGGASLAQWHARGHDEHSLIGDPLFGAPKKDDFHLPKNSPAFTLGFRAFDLRNIGPRKDK